jgi:hypothetical protein
VQVFPSPEPDLPSRIVGENEILDAAPVLPEFTLSLRELFATPL